MDFNKKIKLLHIIPSLEIGGAQEIIVEIAKNINKDKFKMMVYCLQNKSELLENICSQGVEVVLSNQKSNYDFKILPKIVNFLKKERPDIIHTWMFGADLWGRLAAILTNVPIKVSSIVSKYEIYKWKNHLADRLLEPFTDKFIFCNDSAIDFSIRRSGVKQSKIVKLSEPVDVEKFYRLKERVSEYKRDSFRQRFGIRKDLPIVGIIARLEEQKGVKYFIEAAGILEKDINAQYLIVGNGTLRYNLENYVKELRIKSPVIFTGFQHDLPLIYSLLDVLVISSIWEGKPLVMLYAMAAEVPVVGVGIDGIAEVLIENETGFPCKPRDSFALAESIKKAITKTEMLKRITEQAKILVSESFNSKKVIRDYEALYLSLFGEKLRKN